MKRLIDNTSCTAAAFLPVIALVAGTCASTAAMAKHPAIPYSKTEVFIELNDTDGDLGIHALIDGDPWTKLEIRGPDRRRLLKTKLSGDLADQGLTEYFFESAEPTFDELTPQEFFDRFPEGVFTVKGRTTEGDRLAGATLYTHNVPAPAFTMINGMEDTSTECDEEEDEYNPVEVSKPVIVSWDPVTTTHPDMEGVPQRLVVINNYELVVEILTEVDGKEFSTKFSAVLPPDVTSVALPEDFMAQSDGHVKYEVLAREESFNQTAIESCFYTLE